MEKKQVDEVETAPCEFELDDILYDATLSVSWSSIVTINHLNQANIF